MISTCCEHSSRSARWGRPVFSSYFSDFSGVPPQSTVLDIFLNQRGTFLSDGPDTQIYILKGEKLVPTQFYLGLDLVHLQQMPELADEAGLVDGGVRGDETVVRGEEVGDEAVVHTG